MVVWPRKITAFSTDPETRAAAALAAESRADIGSVAGVACLGDSVTLADVLGSGDGGHFNDATEPAGPEDPVLLERLIELDAMYARSIPGFLEEHAEALRPIEAMHARRRIFPVPREARFHLPFSTLRRLHGIMALAPQRVLLNDDIDALGIVLASSAAGQGAPVSVDIIEPDARRRVWLSEERERWPGAQEHVRILSGDEASEQPSGDYDIVVVQVGHPALTATQLRYAFEQVNPDGHVLASLRAPWDLHFVQAMQAANIELVDQWREIDVPTLPGGFVLDGASDIVVLKRPAAGADALKPWQGDVSDHIEKQPYHWLDFDSLAQTSDDVLEQFLDVVAWYSARPEFARSLVREEERQLATWFDDDGYGFTAEFVPGEAHLLVTLVPYDLQLEYAVQCAAFHVLGDKYTRVRPHRTVHWLQENIVA